MSFLDEAQGEPFHDYLGEAIQRAQSMLLRRAESQIFDQMMTCKPAPRIQWVKACVCVNCTASGPRITGTLERDVVTCSDIIRMRYHPGPVCDRCDTPWIATATSGDV